MLVAGLGASGVAAVRYLLSEGASVLVWDANGVPPKLAELNLPAADNYCGRKPAELPSGTFKTAVLSPGISLDSELGLALKAASIEIIGDIELFARAANDAGVPVIGITGSNGKSTVTTLVGEMAKAAGLRVGIGGNLGPASLGLLKPDAQLYVLELSSFQLETTSSLRCKAATILNLSQDHLDRHGTMEIYGAIKATIFNNCEHSIVNRDDAAVLALAPRQVTTFGIDKPAARQYGLVEAANGLSLAYGDEILVSQAELKIFGLHNAANALAALALADAAGIARDASIRALKEFAGLPHRCEFVAEVAGVSYFNDSKGTNVGSTVAAINGLPAPIIWLAGGQGKGQDFTELGEPLARKGRAAVLFGEDATKIEKDIAGALPVYREVDMFAALKRAQGIAVKGDRVLLSPACASFDQFKSYVDRGEKFRAAVKGLAS